MTATASMRGVWTRQLVLQLEEVDVFCEREFDVPLLCRRDFLRFYPDCVEWKHTSNEDGDDIYTPVSVKSEQI